MSDFKLQKKEKLKELIEKMNNFAKNGDVSGVVACSAQIQAVIQKTENDSKQTTKVTVICKHDDA